MAGRILIVGGGAGGTILANQLARRHFQVTVLSASERHMFQPALLYIAFKNSGRDIFRRERSLLDRRVELIHDAASSVDFKARRVTTAGGRRRSWRLRGGRRQ